MNEGYIECDVDPLVPNNWRVEEHQKGGLFKWDAAQVQFYFDFGQQDENYISGNKLSKRLAGKPVLNANVLDYLLKNPHLIPDDWKKGRSGHSPYIYFWGTIYRGSDSKLYVRFLRWDGGKWCSFAYCLNGGWGMHAPAAMRAS